MSDTLIIDIMSCRDSALEQGRYKTAVILSKALDVAGWELAEKMEKEEKPIFSKEYCSICGKEMRKWLDIHQCNAMCVNSYCEHAGRVYETIQNVANIKITSKVNI